jgi:Asp/Glu/hydantoin racemase
MDKVLIINPNTSVTITALMRSAACDMLPAGTVIEAVTAPFGAEGLETRAELAIAGHAVLTALANHHQDCTAVIIGAFLDPALAAARELVDIPVVGTGACAFDEAGKVGPFAIITLGHTLAAELESYVSFCGWSNRLTGIHFLPTDPVALAGDRGAMQARIIELATAEIAEGARAIVLGGSPFTGLGAELSSLLGVPVADGIAPAVRRVRAAWSKTAPCSPVNRPGKLYRGLDPALVGLLTGEPPLL